MEELNPYQKAVITYFKHIEIGIHQKINIRSYFFSKKNSPLHIWRLKRPYLYLGESWEREKSQPHWNELSTKSKNKEHIFNDKF